ncbi:hypothetical protein BJV78DRAFT_244840 [Lactifluus subvellereus]|nr:hypothetical protein BJV78DRAFT_244840 [Lactifluus subvellereus]
MSSGRKSIHTRIQDRVSSDQHSAPTWTWQPVILSDEAILLVGESFTCSFSSPISCMDNSSSLQLVRPTRSPNTPFSVSSPNVLWNRATSNGRFLVLLVTQSPSQILLSCPCTLATRMNPLDEKFSSHSEKVALHAVLYLHHGDQTCSRHIFTGKTSIQLREQPILAVNFPAKWVGFPADTFNLTREHKEFNPESDIEWIRRLQRKA